MDFKIKKMLGLRINVSSKLFFFIAHYPRPIQLGPRKTNMGGLKLMAKLTSSGHIGIQTGNPFIQSRAIPKG